MANSPTGCCPSTCQQMTIVSVQAHYWYKRIIIIINIFKWQEMFLVRAHVAHSTATYLYFQVNLSTPLLSFAYQARMSSKTSISNTFVNLLFSTEKISMSAWETTWYSSFLNGFFLTIIKWGENTNNSLCKEHLK